VKQASDAVVRMSANGLEDSPDSDRAGGLSMPDDAAPDNQSASD